MAMMIISERKNLQAWRTQQEGKGQIGFVPTMGNLHAGHLSLMAQALKENAFCIVSIFVNPKQFGPTEDFARYPRTLAADRALMEKTFANDLHRLVLFAPQSSQEIYPEGFQTQIKVAGISDILEGEKRHDHFVGVATVVYVLFILTKPHVAYFGKKDFQQLIVLKKMVSDLGLPITLSGQPIIRDSDGLALSSRNQYLTPEQRKQALHLPQTLQKLQQEFLHKKNSLEWLQQTCQKIVTDDHFWDYLEVRESHSLQAPSSHSREMVLLAVYRVGTTRLLDNLELS